MGFRVGSVYRKLPCALMRSLCKIYVQLTIFRLMHFSTTFERVLVKKTQNEFSTFWLHLPPVEFSPPLSV